MKKIGSFFKELWFRQKMALSIVFGIFLIFVVLSFFIDIGYILTPILILLIFWYANKTSEEEPIEIKKEADIVQEEENELSKLLIELEEVEIYLKGNPYDFHARHKRTDLENQINNLIKK